MMVFFGLPIQLYGLILSLAMVVGWWLAIRKAKQHHLNSAEVETASTYAIIGGIGCARVWHVATDWQLYQFDWWGALKIWQGGLSILGAVTGGVLGLLLWQKVSNNRTLKLTELLDLSVFGLPFAQAVGRWGNYLNQELYGWPTSLPWGIYIEPQFRISGLENFSHFHPLFAYEAGLMLLFGLGLWLSDRPNHRSSFKIGTGFFFWLYLTYYSVIRFGLDFLRPDKSSFFGGVLGTNQLVLLLVAVVGMIRLTQIVRTGNKI